MMRGVSGMLRCGSRFAKSAAAVVLVVALMAAMLTAISQQAAAQASPPRTQIIFDGSGSMWGKLPGDATAKYVLVREALRQTLPALDRTAEVGLVLYGHRRRGDCSDVEQAVTVSPLDPERLLAPLESVNPKGRGPLTLAMVAAADVLPSSEGKTSLILVHDDYDNCQADPCQIAGELHRVRPKLAVHVVSIGAKPEDVERMACVPRITGGRHFDVREASGVAPAIAEALRLATLEQPTSTLNVPRPRAVTRDMLGPPGLRLSATLGENDEPLAEPLTWRIFREGEEASRPVAETTEAAPHLSLRPGKYVVEAQRDLVSVRQTVEVAENRPTPLNVQLEAGLIQLSPSPLAAADATGPSAAAISLVAEGEGASEGSRVVWVGPAEKRDLMVPPGSYRVVLQDGQYRAERSIVVPSGSRGAPPLATAAGHIRVEAKDHVGSEDSAEQVLFRVLEDDPSAPDGRREVARSAASQAEFTLPAGTYHLVARKGAAEARELIALRAGDKVSRTLNLKLARLSLSALLPGGMVAADTDVTWRVVRLDGDSRGEVARSVEANPELLLAAGTYRIESRFGRLNAVASQEITLAEGSAESLALRPEAAELRLRLMHGGLPLSSGDVFWELRDGSGQVVWRTMEPEPREFLAKGHYTVRAETRERQLEAAVNLAPGDKRVLELNLE